MDEAVVRIILDSAGGGSTPAKSNTPQPQQPSPPTQLTQPQPTQPIPVKLVDPPKPPPPPAAPAQPPLDWMKSLIDPIREANRHVLLEGQSGTGKSHLARAIAFERMAQGEEVHVVDAGHGASQWKGAASVFGQETAGKDAAKFLRETLEGRKLEKEKTEKATGRLMLQEDFKPMTLVFSDFKKLLQDTPKLATELNAMLQEARKFNIAVLAETASLSGVKGVASMRGNFAQQAQTSGSPTQGTGKVGLAGQIYDAPELPDYKDKFDPSIIREPSLAQPPPIPEVKPPFDPQEEARKQREKEERKKQTDAAYKDQYGGDEKKKGVLDTLLGTAEKMRGAMGGMFGGMAGIALDTTAAMRKLPESDGEGGMSGAATALGGVAIAAVAVVKGFQLLDGEVQKSIQRYGDYSPSIAAAQAQAEMTTMLADMRRAQEHGPEIARYIQAQTEMQNAWEEVKMQFMEAAMPVMEAIMKGISAILTIGNWYKNKEDENDIDDLFNFNPLTINSNNVGGAVMPGGSEANSIFGS